MILAESGCCAYRTMGQGRAKFAYHLPNGGKEFPIDRQHLADTRNSINAEACFHLAVYLSQVGSCLQRRPVRLRLAWRSAQAHQFVVLVGVMSPRSIHMPSDRQHLTLLICIAPE